MQGRPFSTMSTRLPGISTELSTGRLSVEHPILSVCGIEGNAAGKAFLIIVNAALQREARRAVRPQIHSQSEFCARHCGCGEAGPEPRGRAILLTTAANLAREWHRCRLAFTGLWPFGGQRTPLEGTSGRVCHGRSRKGQRSAVVAGLASSYLLCHQLHETARIPLSQPPKSLVTA